MACTVTVRDVADFARANAELVPLLGTAGWADEPALTIASQVIAEMLTPNFPWKWNRKTLAPFTTVPWQQDYSTGVTDAAWLEHATRTETASVAPIKPIFEMQCVRDLPPTSRRGWPVKICWIPNSQAICGVWAADSAVSAGQQIRDGNGNVQVASMGGTTGAAAPAWSTQAGGATADGSVAWTAMDPCAAALRISPVPVETSQPWQMTAIYQRKPPALATIASTWAPVPDELAFAYRQGFLAFCYRHANKYPEFVREYALFKALLQEAVGNADIEADAYGFIPRSDEELVWYW